MTARMIKHIVPHIPSTDPEVTKAFLIEMLDMTVIVASEQYVELDRDGAVIGILSSDEEPNEQSIAIEVSNLEKLWEDKKTYLEGFHTRALFTQPYGVKEFHVVAPETNTLIFFSERI